MPSHVQVKGIADTGGGDPGTTLQLTFDSPLTVGNVVVGAIYSTGTPTITALFNQARVTLVAAIQPVPVAPKKIVLRAPRGT
jgi:hypothetical protein